MNTTIQAYLNNNNDNKINKTLKLKWEYKTKNEFKIY